MSYLGYDLRNIALPLSEKISLNKDDSRISRTVHDSHGLTPSSVQLTDEDITSISYFDDKEIFTHLNEIVERLLKDRPEDPESYILRELRIWDGKESGNEYTEVLLHERSGRMQAPTNKNFLFHAQFQEAEKKNRAQLEKERQALDYERIRAFDFTSSTEEHHEKPVESSRAREVILLKQLIEALNQRKTQLQADSLARTIDLGESGEPLLSTKMLRFVIGLGITGDESQLSSNALKFYRKCIQNANVIPLEHPFRLSYEGPLHFSDLHALHDPLALNVFPVQGPSVCYQAVHKLLIEYSYSQGKEMHDQNIQDASPRTAAKHGQNLDGKGMHIVFQFHVLMRVCHMWLVVATEPVKEWSRLLHLSLYTLIGYEGFYLSSRLIADLGRAFEEVFLVELHSALRKERSLEASCFLNAQVCFRWIVKESTHILEDLKTPHTHVNEDQSFSSSQMTVKKLLESVLSNTMHRPHRLEETTLFQISSPDDAPHLLSKADVSLDFSRVTEARIQNALFANRHGLIAVTETSELLDFFQQFETKPIMEVADQLDILAFGERDDLAVLLSVALQCMEDPIGSSGLSHVTKIREIAPRSADILFLRSKLVVAFVGAIVAAQYESTVAFLAGGTLQKNFAAPSIPPVFLKCMTPQNDRPTLIEVLLKRFKFTSMSSLSFFFEVLTKVMIGEGGISRSLFEASMSGFIFMYYAELTQLMCRYVKQMESKVFLILLTRWNRLVRYSVFSAVSYAVYSQSQVFSATHKKKVKRNKRFHLKHITHKVHDTKDDRLSSWDSMKDNLLPKPKSGEPGDIFGHLVIPHSALGLTSVEEQQLSEKLYTEVRKGISGAANSGIFLDSIQNPITRGRVAGKVRGFTIREWDYIQLTQHMRNSALWFHEFLFKSGIMVQYDVNPHEVTRIATLSLLYFKDIVASVEQEYQQQFEEDKAPSATTANSAIGESPLEDFSKSSPAPKHLNYKPIFDTVLCHFAGCSHILGAFLFQSSVSGCPSFVFSEAQSRWNSISEVEQEKIITKSLPQDVSFSSASYEKSRSRLRFCLDRLFSGEISLEKNIDLVLVLFRCGVMPCRYFDFFSSIQTLVNLAILTPNAPPYFTHLAHRVLRVPLFFFDRRLDYYTRGKEPMREAWEQYLHAPSAVFEASKAIINLIPRDLMLRGDVTMLREKMRSTPHKLVHMFSSRVNETDIMLVSVWFRLHSDIPQAFLEAFGVTLYDIFLSSYDQSYSMVEELQQILRVDRAFRVILSSSQPKMGDLEHLQKLVQDAVAPKYKFPRTHKIEEELKRSDVLQTRTVGEASGSSATSGFPSLPENRFSSLTSRGSYGMISGMSVFSASVSHVGVGEKNLKVFDTLMTHDMKLDERAWRSHVLSVHLVYAITHPRTFAGSHYADATLRYLVDLCFLLHYVRVDTYVHYFYRFFVRLLTIGHEPQLLYDITAQLFETLDALQIPFDIRMPIILSTILTTHLEQSHNEKTEWKRILSFMPQDERAEGFEDECREVLPSFPLMIVYLYRAIYLRFRPEEPAQRSVLQKRRSTNAGLEAPSFLPDSATAMELVHQFELMVKDVIKEIFYLLNHLIAAILTNQDGEDTLLNKMDDIVSGGIGSRALQMMVLLSTGSSSLGLKFISCYGAYIEKRLMTNDENTFEVFVVWSRAVGSLTTYFISLLKSIFEYSPAFKDLIKTFPREVSKISLIDEILDEVERVEAFLTQKETVSGLYVCGSPKRYYRDIAGIVYPSILDYKFENMKAFSQQLDIKLEGSDEDIVVGLCCVLPGLAIITKDQEDLLRITGSPTKPNGAVFGKESRKAVVPILLRLLFSSIQRLFRGYDRHLGNHLETMLSNRAKSYITLRQALTADLFPVPFHEGLPMTMNLFIPSPVTFVKQRLLRSILEHTQSVCLMDAAVAEQIENRVATCRSAAERENLLTVNPPADAVFLFSYREDNRLLDTYQRANEVAIGKGTAAPAKVRVLPFFLYNEMDSTDLVFDALFSSGLMTSDVMRFSNALDNIMSVPSKNNRAESLIVSGPAVVTCEDKSLRKIWRNMLCLISQRFRRSISHSKLNIYKELTIKTAKAFLNAIPSFHLTLLKEARNTSDFVGELGQVMPNYPYVEKWLLPPLLRSACLVEDRQIINATKRLLRDNASERKKSEDGSKNPKGGGPENAVKHSGNPDNVSVVMLENPVTKMTLNPSSSKYKLDVSRALQVHQLPLATVEDILLDAMHPQCQTAIISILQTLKKSSSDGEEMTRLLFRSFFFELSKQRLARLNQRWCLLESECDAITDLWRRFRAADRPGPEFHVTDSAGSGTPSVLGKQLAKLLNEPEEVTEALIVFLDRLFITQLKSIFRWSSPTASLLAMYIYTDSVESYRSLYFLRSRWCAIAITICNTLQVWGGVHSNEQLLLLVRALRGVRLMRCTLDRLHDPKNIISFLQSLPYQKLINAFETEDVYSLVLTAAPPTVNRAVLEGSLQGFVGSLSEILVSLRAMSERLQGMRAIAKTLHPFDLLQAFIDWSVINASQPKTPTRASFKGLALLLSTALNNFSESDPPGGSSTGNIHNKPAKRGLTFMQTGGVGNASMADQLRMLLIFSFGCSCGLREFLKDEKIINRSSLSLYTVREIRLGLPNQDEVFNSDGSRGSGDLGGSASLISRPFSDTCKLAALTALLSSGPVKIPESFRGGVMENKYSAVLVQLVELIMNFVVSALKENSGTPGEAFMAQETYICSVIEKENICFLDMCLVSFFVSREISNRGKGQLSAAVTQCCEYLVATFCRSTKLFFERHEAEKDGKSLKQKHAHKEFSVSTSSISFRDHDSWRSITESRKDALFSTGFLTVFPDKNLKSVFVRTQQRLSSMDPTGTFENALDKYERAVHRQASEEFVFSDIQIFSFVWITCFSDLVGMFRESLPFYFSAISAFTQLETTSEELQIFFIFIHRVAFSTVKEKWLTANSVDLRIREWLEAMKEYQSKLNSGEEEATDENKSRLVQVASAAVYALTAALAKRMLRSEHQNRTRIEASELASETPATSFQGSNSMHSTSQADPVFVPLNSSRVNMMIKSSCALALTYIVGRIAKICKISEKDARNLTIGLQHKTTPRTAHGEVDVMRDPIVAESSLLRHSIEAQRDAKAENSHTFSKGPRSSGIKLFSSPSASSLEIEDLREDPLDSAKKSSQKVSLSPLSTDSSPLNEGEKKRKGFNNLGKESNQVKQKSINSPKNNRGTDASALPRVIDGYVTPKDLAAAHTPECTWTVINGVVYDITKFAMIHPGGSTVLISHCAGQDCTDAFVKMHLGNEKVLKQLEKMRIGVIR